VYALCMQSPALRLALLSIYLPLCAHCACVHHAPPMASAMQRFAKRRPTVTYMDLMKCATQPQAGAAASMSAASLTTVGAHVLVLLSPWCAPCEKYVCCCPHLWCVPTVILTGEPACDVAASAPPASALTCSYCCCPRRWRICCDARR
jgi:hypothetical protein